MRPRDLFFGLLCSMVLLATAGCAPPVPDDDDDSGDDDDTVPSQIDGYVTLSAYLTGAGGNVYETATASAVFYEVIEASTPGVEYGMPAGVDQCAVTLYTAADLNGGDPGQYGYQSAGALTFDGPTSFAVQPTNQAGMTYYQASLTIGAELRYGSSYDVSAAGAAFPSFAISGAVDVPAELSMTQPDPASGFVAGHTLDVTWSGGDGGTMWLTLSSWSGQQYGTVYCEVTNDGSFSIGAADLGDLPSGQATLTLMQTHTRYESIDGRFVAFMGNVGNTASGSL